MMSIEKLWNEGLLVENDKEGTYEIYELDNVKYIVVANNKVFKLAQKKKRRIKEWNNLIKKAFQF